MPCRSLQATLRVTSYLLESFEYLSILIKAKREKGCINPERAKDKENYYIHVNIAILLLCFDT